MFTELLSVEEKMALLKLITGIAKADGEITKEEADFLSVYASEIGVSVDLDSDFSIEDTCALLCSYKAKIITMQEIIKMALVDGNYDEQERNGALIISQTLGIPLEKFLEIENWVIEGHNWVARGEKLLTES